MIATGLVFVLGALVAALLCLLFVPFLWRNAQRLARRDFAATMPTSMNEIRAEVDRVRAEAAMNVRRHEMLAQKARDRAARERAEVGRLTAAGANMAFLSDQHGGEVNVLRGQLQIAQERITALEEAQARLEDENVMLRQGFMPGDAGIGASSPSASESIPAAARPPAILPAATPLDPEGVPDPLVTPDERPVDDAAEGARDRVAAATAALMALASERRESVDAGSITPASEGAPAQAYPVAGLPRVGPRDMQPASPAEIAVVERAGASEPTSLPSQNAEIREKIADIAARVIQMTSLKEGPGSPIAKLLSPGGSPSEPSDGSPSLAERVRRLTHPQAAEEPLQNGADHAAVAPPAEPETPPVEIATAETDAAAPLSPAAKRRRGGARSRRPSPR